MQPFEMKLDYRGRSWCTVKFELGHNEIGDADEPDHQLSASVVTLLTEVGLEVPMPVPVMRSDHQVAQKLHAMTADRSERAHDLVNRQLLDSGVDLDLRQVHETCIRLFAYRRQQAWPPTVLAGSRWDSLYTEAAEGLKVLPTVEESVDWANALIRRIAAAAP